MDGRMDHSVEPDVRFMRHVAKDNTINAVALDIERAFSGARVTRSEDALLSLQELLRRAEAISVHVSRRAGDELLITGNLLGRRKDVSVAGYDMSLSMRCIEARRLLQFEVVEAAGADSLQPRILSAQPVACRGVGIGAILVSSARPLDAREEKSLAELSDALAGVLDDMVLSESLRQLLDWRKQDMSFCGPPLDLQDAYIPEVSSLRPLADRIPVAPLDAPFKEVSGKETETYTETMPGELPDQLIIRVLGLSLLYLSAVIAGNTFADGHWVAPSFVAILALVSGLGSLAVLFPGLRNRGMTGELETKAMSSSASAPAYYNTTSASTTTTAPATATTTTTTTTTG